MSEQAAEAGRNPEEGLDLASLTGDAAFGALMDVLVADEAAGEAAAGGEAGAGDGAGGEGAAAGSPAAGSTGTTDAPDGEAAAGTPAAGSGPAAAGAGTDAGAASGLPAGAEGTAAGTPAVDAAGSVGGDLPAGWDAEPAALLPKLGELSTSFEAKVTEGYQAEALAEVRKEHGPYFDALNKHPRMLVGQQVPAIGKDGMETLRDSNDAKEWQEAVKVLLAQEVQDRAGRALEENRSFIDTIHSSIELFQKNTDLIPGTKSFDRELADRFAALAKPYELRKDGKLQGFTIPVQPIIDQLRTQLTGERAAKPPAPPVVAAAPAGAAGAAPAPQVPAADPPQAGIPSKAGEGEQGEDFSTLFGTLGLPGLRI